MGVKCFCGAALGPPQFEPRPTGVSARWIPKASLLVAMQGQNGWNGPRSVTSSSNQERGRRAMLKNSFVFKWTLAGLGVCAWLTNPPAARAQAGTGKVTAVRLRLVPDSYSGPCPGKVRLVGEITTDGLQRQWGGHDERQETGGVRHEWRWLRSTVRPHRIVSWQSHRYTCRIRIGP